MNTGESVLRVEQVTRRYAGTRSAPGFALEATTLELRAGSTVTTMRCTAISSAQAKCS